MGRPKKVTNNVEDAVKLADELIALEAEKKDKANDPAPEDKAPVDESEVNLDNAESDETYDLSNLDEEPDVVAEDKDLAHKYSVLQGKYEAETGRLSRELSQLNTELQALRTQLATRSSASDATIDDTSSGDAGVETLREQYPELYKGFLSLARQEAKAEVTRTFKGTSEKVDAIVRESDETKKTNYFTKLSELVPAWEQINNHPSFAKWLIEPDEFSGTNRRNLLGSAFNRLDAVTSAKFFNAFIKEKGIKVRGSQSSDDDDIAPDTSGGNVRPQSRIRSGEVTRAEMQKFYQDKAHGRLSGTEAEINKKEARFFQAVREGKVIG